MAIKHILLPLNGEPGGAKVALTALRLAKQFEAHVSAGYEDVLGPLYAQAAGFVPAGPVYGDFFDQMLKLRADRQALARSQFDKAVAATHLPIVSAPTCRQASTMWIQDEKSQSLSTHRLVTDLAVMQAPGASASPATWSLVDTMLFNLRAPILIVPESCDEINFWRPLITWNGSGESLRALKAAVALFPANAEPVVLTVGKLSNGRTTAERAREYLGWHCFSAELRHVDAKASDAAKVIEDEAGRLEAGCVVMGAYTHSRARQLLLGGVTDAMLRSAARPVFMCH